MTSIVDRTLSLIRARTAADGPVCLVCGRPIGPRDAHLALAGGGHVHRGCSTYRMRQRDAAQRLMRRHGRRR